MKDKRKKFFADILYRITWYLILLFTVIHCNASIRTANAGFSAHKPLRLFHIVICQIYFPIDIKEGYFIISFNYRNRRKLYVWDVRIKNQFLYIKEQYHLSKKFKWIKTNLNETFKRQPHKMAKHTQTIRQQQPTNFLSVFDHFVGFALKGLKEISFTNN